MAIKPSEDATEHEWLLSLNPSSVSEAATMTYTLAKLGSLDNARENSLANSKASSKYIVLRSTDQWACDNNGDLNWGYSQACVEQWSAHRLLLYLFEHAFSISTNNYPSTPRLHVQLLESDGLEESKVVTLPHYYRLPLMFIEKYIWEAILSALRQSSTALKSSTSSSPLPTSSTSFNITQILHLRRLTQYLFIRAELKKQKSGMGRGWRCVAFDRFLTRLYRHWVGNDPKALDSFLKTYDNPEYNRDVFKNDWKRWCRKGLNVFKSKLIKLTEVEIANGLTYNQYRLPLRYDPKSEEWILQDETITSKISTLFFGDKITPEQVTVKQQEEENNDILKDAFADVEWSSISELTDSDEDNKVAAASNKPNKLHTIQISSASGTTSLKIKLTPAKRRHETTLRHPGTASPTNDERSTPGRSSKRLRVKAEAKADPSPSDMLCSGPSSSLPSATSVSVKEPDPKIVVKPRPKPRPKANIATAATTMSRTLAAVSKNPQFVPSSPNSKKNLDDEWDDMYVVGETISSTSKATKLTIEVGDKPESATVLMSSAPPTTETPSSNSDPRPTIQTPTVPSTPQSPLPDLAAAVQAMSALVKPFRLLSPVPPVIALEPVVTTIATTQALSSLAKVPPTQSLTLFTTPSSTSLGREPPTSTPVDATPPTPEPDTNMAKAMFTNVEPPQSASLPPMDSTSVSQLASRQEPPTMQDDNPRPNPKTTPISDLLEPTSLTMSPHASLTNPTTSSTSTNKRGRARLINPTIPIISTTELETRRQRGRPRTKLPDPIPGSEMQTAAQQPLSQTSTLRSSNFSVVIQRKNSTISAATATSSALVQPSIFDGKERQATTVVKEKDDAQLAEADQMKETETSGKDAGSGGEEVPQPLAESEGKEKETMQNNPKMTPNDDIPVAGEDQSSNPKSKESAKAKGKLPARSRSSSVEIIGMSMNSPSVTASTSVTKRHRPRATSTSKRASSDTGGKPGGEGNGKGDDDDEIEELVEGHPARKKRKFGPPLQAQKKDNQSLITQRALELLVQLVDKQEVLPVGRPNAVEEGGEEGLSGWQFSTPETTVRSRGLIDPLERDVVSVSRELKELRQRVDDVEKGLEEGRSVRLTKSPDVVMKEPISSSVPREDPEGISPPTEPQTKQHDESSLPHISLDLVNPQMRTSLAIVVDNLVSTKLLALSQTVDLLKPSHSGSESPTRMGSPLGPSASVASVSNDTLAGSSTDSVTVNTLMDEIKALREESVAREQRDKEELQSMRQLHSAEVDALRRRLAYLESQAPPPFDIYDRSRHYPPALPYDGYGPVSAPTRGERHHYYDRHSEHYHESSYRHRERHVPELERASASASRPFSPPPIRGSNIPRRSERGDVLEEEAPLPIKSQRKQHIIGISRGPAS